MSLVTYPNSATAKVSGAAPGKSAMPTKCHSPTVADRLRAFFQANGRWITIAFDAVLEARAQRAMIEAQLYLNRCKHTSKNEMIFRCSDEIHRSGKKRPAFRIECSG